MTHICYMLVGLPGSGKSTVTDKLLKEMPDLIVASTDQYIEEMAQKEGKSYNEMYRKLGDEPTKWMNRKIAKLIKEKQSFIWDQTNVYKSSRLKKTRLLNQHKYKVIAIVLELSDDELNKRIDHRIKSGGKKIGYKIMQEMIKNYTRPSYYEGFEEIYIIGDDNVHNLLSKPIENKSTTNR